MHLDQQYWHPGWRETDNQEWTKRVKDLSSRPRWIMDGNYGGTLDMRMERADTIIFLDYPTTTCLWRITKRIMLYHGQVRPDMPPGCRERLVRRKGIFERLDRLPEEKRVLVFRNDQESQRFLELTTRRLAPK